MSRSITLIATVLFALFSVLPARAQETPPYGLAITYAQAKAVMTAAEAEAMNNNWSVVITIIDSGGKTVMMHRLDNTSYGSIAVSEGKAHTALDFRRPSKAFEGAIAGGGLGLRLLAIPGILPIQGAVPIISGGTIIGAIGVSGVTSEQDEQTAMTGAAAVE